jgi:hypothetical protein
VLRIKPARMMMIEMTTSSSMMVNALFRKIDIFSIV